MILPDETLSEILSYAFYVPDKAFTERTIESSFGKKSTSLCDVLLVCKRWLRVATPFLYEFILLRNTAQAEAFYDTISGPIGQKLLKFVRRVRLDDYFGGIIEDIFKKITTNIELFVCVASNKIYTNLLRQSLCSLNPSRVIFDAQIGYSYCDDYTNVLHNAILQDWKSLTTLEVTVPDTRHSVESELRWLIPGISKSSSLQRVIIKYETTEKDIYIDPIVAEISKSKSIIALSIYVQRRGLLKDYNQISDLVHVYYPKTKEAPRDMVDFNRLRMPTPGIMYDEMYKQILLLHLSSIGEGYGRDERIRMQKERLCELMLVSQGFKRLCLLIQHPDIRSPGHLSKYIFDYKLARELVTGFTISATHVRKEEEKHILNLGLNYFTNITRLEVPSDCVLHISRLTSPVLENIEYLHLNQFSPREPSFTAISQIPNLKTLKLTYFVPEKEELRKNVYIKRKVIALTNIRTVIVKGEIPRPCLAHLLRCQFVNADTFDIDVSEQACKDEPEELEECKNLLLCFPNLINFHIKTRNPQTPYLRAINQSVRKITVTRLFSELSSVEGALQLFEIRNIDTRMKKLDFSGFPALAEVQLMDISEWPWSDCSLKHNNWTYIVDVLSEKYRIKITDMKGVAWKSRAQTRKHSDDYWYYH